MIAAPDAFATGMSDVRSYGTPLRSKGDRSNALTYGFSTVGITWLLIRLWLQHITIAI